MMSFIQSMPMHCIKSVCYSGTVHVVARHHILVSPIIHMQDGTDIIIKVQYYSKAVKFLLQHIPNELFVHLYIHGDLIIVI